MQIEGSIGPPAPVPFVFWPTSDYVRCYELPIGFGVMRVAAALPSGDFSGQGLLIGDAAIQTLG
jgi:hypothetical protein